MCCPSNASIELMICFSFYFQILVTSFEEKLQKAEQKFEETEKSREELINKATDAESKINELKNTMQRFL
jgi:predicted nuclease with TOPRIM domain